MLSECWFLPDAPLQVLLWKGSAESGPGAGNLAHALGVHSRCARVALGGAISILIYAPDRNRIIAVRKMWLSCFNSGKTVIEGKEWYASKAIFFFLINSLLSVLLCFITLSLPAGFNISHVLRSPKKQWLYFSYGPRYLPSHELRLLEKKAAEFHPLPNLSVLAGR